MSVQRSEWEERKQRWNSNVCIKHTDTHTYTRPTQQWQHLPRLNTFHSLYLFCSSIPFWVFKLSPCVYFMCFCTFFYGNIDKELNASTRTNDTGAWVWMLAAERTQAFLTSWLFVNPRCILRQYLPINASTI